MQVERAWMTRRSRTETVREISWPAGPNDLDDLQLTLLQRPLAEDLRDIEKQLSRNLRVRGD